MSCLIDWIEALLFGTSSSPPPIPPPEAKDLILRMEVENIPWTHIILGGGFTEFAYQIHGDLNSLIDHLEKQWLDQTPHYKLPPLKTRAASKFWDHLQLLLARRDGKRLPALPAPSSHDDTILQQVLQGSQDDFHFQSAPFWGEVARKFINPRRLETVTPLPDASPDHLKRVMQLYDITCKARGVYHDPLNMYLVHRSEYVNAAHWQTGQNLEAFMQDRPTHALTLSVQTLLRRTVHELLHGEKPSALLHPCPRLDALLHNIQVIHESVQQVPHENTPPKWIDVLQRLLALSRRDGLWEKEVPLIPAENPFIGTSLLYLTEQLRIAERERRVLWKHAIECEPEYAPEPPKHTCTDYLYASDKRGRSPAERARQTVRHSQC